MTPKTELQLIQTLARIDTKVEDMHDRLFGNGQPGFVYTIDDRVKALEKLESKARGAFYTISLLFSGLTTWMSVHVFRGK